MLIAEFTFLDSDFIVSAERNEAASFVVGFHIAEDDIADIQSGVAGSQHFVSVVPNSLKVSFAFELLLVLFHILWDAVFDN